ncbi:glutathione S-transferase family protein [Psychromarinibacter sp. C21-152]|uniref:Glutathione S-transferase family protein n=1 Tax=Psychromarinibacter sediminicola TaxID=3033385 RepID=A0AAE3NQR2_9RHOB|nr:glutathione S-transferase family protein [Psychromarinibacter sediminicola]MDF0600341.1 glutathione S-transferase family protein [Psychromarinibacter sediminicola]
MKLHVFPPSPNSKKVMLVNAITGLAVPEEVVDITAGVQKAPAFLALNPNGRVPVLELDDGTTLWESNAIANRLAALADSPLWPGGDAQFDVLRWQFWEGCHWTPACARFADKYLFGNETADLEAAAAVFHPFARVLDDHLAGRDWLVGEAMSVADISVAMVVGLREACHYPIAGYDNILRWVGRIEALDAYRRVAGAAEAAA